MDRYNMYLVSRTPDEKMEVKNQSKTPNFESHNITNHPQDQGETMKEGPSDSQHSNGKTSFKPKAQRNQEIHFLAQLSQNNKLVLDQGLLEKTLLKQKPFLYAKSKFEKKSGFLNVASKQKYSPAKETEQEQKEIEEEKVHAEDDEDPYKNQGGNNEDAFLLRDMKEKREQKPILDQNEVLDDKSQDSLIQTIEKSREEKLSLDMSKVIEGSNEESQESLVQAIKEINEGKLDLNVNEVIESWSHDNEEQLIQDVEGRKEGTSYLSASESLKDSVGNNEYSTLQNREENTSIKFNLNANESFELIGSLSEANLTPQQETVHLCIQIRHNEHLFTVIPEFPREGQYESAENLAFKFYLSLLE